jgi:outer membrane usher protein
MLATTESFSQPGVEFARDFPRRQLTLSGGVGLGQNGTIGVSLIDERLHDDSERRITSVSYSRSLPARFVLSVAANRIDSGIATTEVSVNLSRSLGPRLSTSVALSRKADGDLTRIDQRYELPSGPGYGYRTSTQSGFRRISDAEFMANTAFARYGIEFRQDEGSRAVRLQSRGTVARFGGGWFAARGISDGFAVVDAGGLDGVQIYLENRPIGVTRSDGLMLVPRLRPYEQNRLRIETADIPLTMQIENPLLTVSPYYRSGVLASFGVRATTIAVLRATQADGSPIPEGARARIDSGEFAIPVGRDGKLYLEGIAPDDRVEILVRGQACSLDLPEFSAETAFSNLGDVACVQAQRLQRDAGGGRNGE